MILAVDTTSEFGSVALTHDEDLLEEAPLHAPAGYSPVIFDAIAALLQRHGMDLRDVDLFAAAAGPGSFTGVRVGLAAMKGLAETLGKPVAAVSNLAALSSCAASDRRAPLIDARRGEVYAAVYDAAVRLVQPEVVMALPAWLAATAPGLTFVVADFAQFAAALEGTPHEGSPVVEVRYLAAAVARVAHMRGGVDAALADANYVRRSDAELFWRE